MDVEILALDLCKAKKNISIKIKNKNIAVGFGSGLGWNESDRVDIKTLRSVHAAASAAREIQTHA